MPLFPENSKNRSQETEDSTGLTGLRIIDAILSGQRDPQELIKLRDKRVSKSTPQHMQAALVGDYRAEHLFVLSQSLQAYRFHQARIEECEAQTVGCFSETRRGGRGLFVCVK
jgi:transposase